MRRTLLLPAFLIAVTFFIGCGTRNDAVTNANASANVSNQGTGASVGTGPQNQGIGGNTNNGAVNSNTYTVPPGFNKNGDRGSASSTSGNTP
jgi:hypothetical protein